MFAFAPLIHFLLTHFPSPWFSDIHLKTFVFYGGIWEESISI